MKGGEVFFVDTNVLLYAVDPVDDGKRQLAMDWLDDLWMRGAGRLSWQVLHEYYWNALKKMQLHPAIAQETVAALAHWRPVDTSLGLIERAWQLIDAALLSYWDALIVAAAERSGARYVLSEDFQDGREYGGLRVVNPFTHTASDFRADDYFRGSTATSPRNSRKNRPRMSPRQ